MIENLKSKFLEEEGYKLYKCPNCDIAIPIQTDKSQGNVVLYSIVTTTNSPRNGGKKIKITKVTIQKP